MTIASRFRLFAGRLSVLPAPSASRRRRSPEPTRQATRPALTARRLRRFWAHLVLCCLLGNLSLPGLAQAWVAHSAGNDQALIAICTSSGVRMVSLDQAGDPSDFAGKAAAQSDPGTALPGQPGAGGSHCQACLGNGPEGLIHHWAATPAPRLTGELSLNNADAGTVPGTPVWPGAPTRAPPASAD